MKKIVFLLIFIFLSVYASGEALHHTVQDEEVYSLKLRTSRHSDFLRIVLEGDESIISRAIVNQKAQNIVVTFPDSNFTIQADEVAIDYNKIGGDAILFSPGDIRGFKVVTLKYPSRLVVDVYQETKSESKKKKHRLLTIKTVVIDPGHGGYKYGVVRDNYKEKRVVLDIAKKLRRLVRRNYAQSFLTRGSDRFMTLGERIKFTNKKDADIFLSLHIGKHKEIVLYVPMITDSVAAQAEPFLVNRGQEKFTEKTAALLNAMQNAVTSDFGDDMVLIKPLPYSILSKIEAAALMIELPSFEDAYYIEEFKTEITNTLYKGLYIYEEITAE